MMPLMWVVSCSLQPSSLPYSALLLNVISTCGMQSASYSAYLNCFVHVSMLQSLDIQALNHSFETLSTATGKSTAPFLGKTAQNCTFHRVMEACVVAL